MNTEKFLRAYTNLKVHCSPGGHGRIYRANQVNNGNPVIIKHVVHFPGVRIEEDKVPTEILLLLRLQHIFGVCRLLDYCYNDNEYLMVMPYDSKCVDLFDFIKTDPNEDCCLKLCRNIFSIVLDMFEAGYVHRDLKPENVLVNPDTLKVTLIDFDAADLFANTTRCLNGTRIYYPPEYAFERECKSEPMTVWSLGLVLFEMVTNDQLFTSIRDIVEKPVRIPDKVRADVKVLLLGMLQKDPAYRFTFDEVRRHLAM